MNTRVEPQPGALEGCGAPNPHWSWDKCGDRSWYRPRACVVDGGHIHSWARGDSRYCSARCRMKALRARRRAERVTAADDRPQA